MKLEIELRPLEGSIDVTTLRTAWNGTHLATIEGPGLDRLYVPVFSTDEGAAVLFLFAPPAGAIATKTAASEEHFWKSFSNPIGPNNTLPVVVLDPSFDEQEDGETIIIRGTEIPLPREKIQ